MLIDSLMVNDGPAIYYDLAFRNVLEDHMTYLRQHSTTVVKVIDAGKAYEYANDWFGLLGFYGIPAHLHWVCLRMNQRTSPSDSLTGVEVILLPSATTVEQIRQSYSTTNRIS